MRVGLVCPYSFDVPGGVQNHVRDLAAGAVVAWPRGRGAGSGRGRLPDCRLRDDWSGKAVPLRYNGSVARVALGPRVAAQGPPLAEGRSVRSAARARADDAERLAAGAVVGRSAGGGDLPHRQRALARDVVGGRGAAALAGEDLGADRGVGDGPADPGPSSRRRAGRHPQRHLRRPVRQRASPSRSGNSLARRSVSSAEATSRARALSVLLAAMPQILRAASGCPAARRRRRLGASETSWAG